MYILKCVIVKILNINFLQLKSIRYLISPFQIYTGNRQRENICNACTSNKECYL